jgi:Zn-dependent protease with chaperone function
LHINLKELNVTNVISIAFKFICLQNVISNKLAVFLSQGQLGYHLHYKKHIYLAMWFKNVWVLLLIISRLMLSSDKLFFHYNLYCLFIGLSITQWLQGLTLSQYSRLSMKKRQMSPVSYVTFLNIFIFLSLLSLISLKFFTIELKKWF